jgi:hypothetical protein
MRAALLTRGTVAIGAAVFALVLAGCSGDEAKPASGDDDSVAQVDPDPSTPPAETSSEPVDTDLPSDDDIEAYFNAVSTYDVGDLKHAMKLSEPGSIAEAYAGYFLGAANASIDGGYPLAGDLPIKVDGGYKACTGKGEDACVTWADVEGRDGKIVNFTINGKELGPRISAGTGKSVDAGSLGQVKLLYAYQSVQSGGMFVVAEVRSGAAPITIGSYQATYRSREGRQSTAAETTGPTELAAKSLATIVLSFPNAEPGGTVTIPMFSEDFMTDGQAVLKTR